MRIPEYNFILLKDVALLNLHFDLLQQSNLYKSREDRYHSKIRALETLATGTSEENEVWWTGGGLRV